MGPASRNIESRFTGIKFNSRVILKSSIDFLFPRAAIVRRSLVIIAQPQSGSAVVGNAIGIPLGVP